MIRIYNATVTSIKQAVYTNFATDKMRLLVCHTFSLRNNLINAISFEKGTFLVTYLNDVVYLNWKRFFHAFFGEDVAGVLLHEI